MSEKWQEFLTDKQLKKVQSIEIENLKLFIKICNELKLEYVVYGGTLLGAIKYNNIIPWDDDIDVAMPRKDYDKFVREAGEHLPEGYILQTPYNEKKSPYAYTKLRKKGTKYIEEFHHKLDIEKGVYIDIYPIDNIPNDDKLRKKQFKKVKFWILIYYYRQCLRIKKTKSFKLINKYIILTVLYCILRLIPQKFIINKIDYNMTKYNSDDTDRKACLFSPNYDNIYTRFYPLVTKQFGDIKVFSPNCYDDHLTKRYGDYKKELPDDKKIGHIPYEIEL